MKTICTIPGLDDVLGTASPFASCGAAKRIKCPIEDVQNADDSTYLPLMTFCSSDFRKLQIDFRETKGRTGSEKSFGFMDEQAILQSDLVGQMSG